MKTVKFALFGILGFLLLNLYAGYIPYFINNFPQSYFSQLFNHNPLFWILFWLIFFVLAFFVARFLLKLKGLRSFGLTFKTRWKKQLFLGLGIGLSLKVIQYVLFYSFGKFEVTGIADPSSIGMVLFIGTLIAIFPSAINDLAIRGFLLGYFRRLNLMKWFVVVSALLYALDDIWNEGLSLSNSVFSIIYGLSLGYTVYKTGAIWMSIGLHIGGNFIYQMLNGMNGQGLLLLENVTSGTLYEYINIILAALLFPIVYLILNYRNKPVFPASPFKPAV